MKASVGVCSLKVGAPPCARSGAWIRPSAPPPGRAGGGGAAVVGGGGQQADGLADGVGWPAPEEVSVQLAGAADPDAVGPVGAEELAGAAEPELGSGAAAAVAALIRAPMHTAAMSSAAAQ